MKVSALIVTGLIVFVTLAQFSFADEPSWNIQVALVDGSRIVGVPANKWLKVDVGFGELEVPLERIRRADFHDDGKTIHVELNNEDVFTGTMQPEPVEIETAFGKVTLQMKYFQALEVRPTNLLGWLPSTRGLALYYSFDRVGDGVVTNLAGDKHVGKLGASLGTWEKQLRQSYPRSFGVRGGKTEVIFPHDT